MFPKISRKIEENQEAVKIQFLTENLEFILDRNKCIGCATCQRVCPKEAISRGPVGAAIRYPTTEDLIPEVYDPNKCVFCGTCVYMCPWSALTLKINGEVIELDKIPLVEKKALPKLEFTAKKVKNLEGVERTVKQYAKAKIEIVDEECPGGCKTCVDVCPTGAIIVPPKSDKGWEKVPNVLPHEDFDDLCVACGACDNGCPTGAIKLTITEVNHSGDFNEPFWPDMVERLKTLKWSEKEES